jgi:hypothetical protein
MKKLILICIVMTLGLFSCQMNGSANTEEIKGSLTYFKDPNTGLCFASINSVVDSYYITSITCVPCDSLKKIGIK